MNKKGTSKSGDDSDSIQTTNVLNLPIPRYGLIEVVEANIILMTSLY